MPFRVTEIIDYLTEPELLAWMLRTPKAKREASSKDSLLIGTRVDLLIQESLFPPSPSLSTLSQPLPQEFLPEHKIAISSCMNAWEKFKVDRPEIVAGIKSIQTEFEHDGIIGHPDIYYEDASRWGIIDVKTSRTMYPRYWTQTAKYTDIAKPSRHPEDTKPRFIGILRLDKESGNYHYMEIDDEEQIKYEISVFQAYQIAYMHNSTQREFIRQQLEQELINVK